MLPLEVQACKEAQRQKQRAMTIGSPTTTSPANWRVPCRHDIVLDVLVPHSRMALAELMALLLPQLAAQPQPPSSDQQNLVWGTQGSGPVCSMLPRACLDVLEARSAYRATSPFARMSTASMILRRAARHRRSDAAVLST